MTLLVHTHEVSNVLIFSLSEHLQLSVAHAIIILPLDDSLSLLIVFPSSPWSLQSIFHAAAREIPLKHEPVWLIPLLKTPSGSHLISTKMYCHYQDIHGLTVANTSSPTSHTSLCPAPTLLQLHWPPLLLDHIVMVAPQDLCYYCCFCLEHTSPT